MTKLQLMRVERVKNAIQLSLLTKARGEQGWTLQELSQSCKTSVPSLKPFVVKMQEMGYLQQENDLYCYSKKVSINSVDKISTMIVESWGKNIYRSALTEKLKEFTTLELEYELSRRKKLEHVKKAKR